MKIRQAKKIAKRLRQFIEACVSIDKRWSCPEYKEGTAAKALQRNWRYRREAM